jgi:type I restriction enzyme S subunit
LSDITSKIGSGATPRGGEESYKSEGISLIRSLNVYDDGFRDRKLAFIDDVQAKALANVEVKTGDVLLNITGASIARTCIAPQEYLPARVNQHVSIIRPKPEIISSEYLHFLLRSQKMKSSLLGVGNSGGSTRQALTKVDLENTIIEFPPEVENQKKVVDELKLFRDLSQTYMNNLRKLESLYSDLQNSLLISELSGSVI